MVQEKRRQALSWPHLLFFLTGAAFGLLVSGAFRAKQVNPPYPEVRSRWVATQAASAGHQDVVVFGDSVIESTWLEGACGRTFNAGVGGARADDVHNLASATLPGLRPSIIVVAVGANHFWDGDQGLPEFRAEYRALIEDMPKARLILVGVPNSEAASDYVRQLAATHGATYLPPTKGSTADGVHLTSLDAQHLRNKIKSACAGVTASQAAGD